MPMIRHQREGEQSDRVPLESFPEYFFEGLEILVLTEDFLPSIAAIERVVDFACNIQSFLPRHLHFLQMNSGIRYRNISLNIAKDLKKTPVPFSVEDRFMKFLASLAWLLAPIAALQAEHPVQFSGVYPHLAMFNNENECGTGAVVPWADRLWVITYAPHMPRGSSDKLYEIDEQLNVTIRPESVGGTPANRMIHRESQQLLIGPYVIDHERNVRTITPQVMPGRLTGTSRHLFDPGNKVYYATMEEGFYEVDVNSLAVKELFPDANGQKNHAGELLPGYHGKGLYSSQGRLVYANNGELSSLAQQQPDIDSGCLAEWFGKDGWRVVRRNQFTEVTGPGGIAGNEHPESDPIWAVGWDHRSLLLMLLDNNEWKSFRLPKASHCYDGAHGWNTEWPRIRDIGEDDLLMTMHGMFWRFPKTFSSKNTAGIRARSSYLKVIGDFCRWGEKIVFGCDDTAKAEFLNKRKAKGDLVGPGQSQSNLWFVDPAQIDHLGPAAGQGAVWLNDDVRAETPSDPFLFGGFDLRGLHLSHESDDAIDFHLEVDRLGNGQWTPLKSIRLAANGYRWVDLSDAGDAEWIRLSTSQDCKQATAQFHISRQNSFARPDSTIAEGLLTAEQTIGIGGLIRARGENLRTMQFSAVTTDGQKLRDLEDWQLHADAKLRPLGDPSARGWLSEKAAIPSNIVPRDGSSVLYIDDDGQRYRLPLPTRNYEHRTPFLAERIDREVCTERDLFNAFGAFYELPARNAGGFGKIRPVCTHRRNIHDYCSYRGLLILSGVDADATSTNPHLISFENGSPALWAGVVDDLWNFGAPTGFGGPWDQTEVAAGIPSDPYLLNGYLDKRLDLTHDARVPINVAIEIDITGNGNWKTYQSISVPAGRTAQFQFPRAFQGYWVRFQSDTSARITALLEYNL